LRAYEWPGNVREFAHAIQSAVMLTDNDRLSIADLPTHLWEGEITPAEDWSEKVEDEHESEEMDGDRQFSLDEVISRASKTALLRALRETGGNCHRAAQLLGVSRYTVYRMIARYGLGSIRSRQSNLGSITAKA
jgi:two-component system, NtrC family, response regulator